MQLPPPNFLKKHPVDLLFADIQMPDLNDLDLIRAIENKPMIIFTTAHRKFAFEGFELQAIDYLFKPVSFERFTKAVAKAEEYHKFKLPRHQVKNTCMFIQNTNL